MGGRFRGRGRVRRSDRGVSDVVGTILLLALTVTLFSSIFLFVDTFPKPPAQPASQFSAELYYGATVSGSAPINAIKITHLAGPTLAPNTGVSIYLFSSDHPTRFTSAFTLTNGLNGSNAWNLGGTWWLSLTSYSLKTPDNITISIVSSTSLLYRVTLPGLVVNLPPQFVAVGTTPAQPTAGEAFTVYAEIVDPTLKTDSVYANVSQIPDPGIGTDTLMTYSSTTNLWTITVPNGAPAAGTYYVFVNATDNSANGAQVNSVAIPVVVTSSAASGGGSSDVAISVNPTPPVNGTAGTVYAAVTNPGTSLASATVTFYSSGATIGSSTADVQAGGTTQFSASWTPSSIGVTLLSADANFTSGVDLTGALNVTVYPSVLYIAHSEVSGRLSNNTSAYLAEEIQAAGFPFTESFVPCTSNLVSAATTYEAYNLVIIDFGSTNGGSCATTLSTTQQGYVTTAMTSSSRTAFLVVGASVFSTTSCATSGYTAAFLTDLGISNGGGSGTCFTSGTATTTSLTWTSTAASGFLGDGIGTLTLNKTLAGSTGFRPYSYFAKGTTHTFLTAAGEPIGSWTKVTGAGRGAAIGTDPSLIMSTLPAPTSAAWGVGGAATEVLYNVLNYLSGLSSASTPGHAMPDFAISGATLVGVSASHLSYVYVTVRGNGPAGGLVTVSLTINGTLALFNGAPVLAEISVPSSGQDVTTVLTWEAPGVANYQLAVVGSSVSGTLYATTSQLPLNVLNQATVFHT